MSMSVSGGSSNHLRVERRWNRSWLFRVADYNIYFNSAHKATPMKWEHWSFTWSDNGIARLYRNNELLDTQTGKCIWCTIQPGCVIIGQEQGSYCGGFNAGDSAHHGMLDEFMIFDHV